MSTLSPLLFIKFNNPVVYCSSQGGIIISRTFVDMTTNSTTEENTTTASNKSLSSITADCVNTNRKCSSKVSFGFVETRYHERYLGGGGSIPDSGGFVLGLGWDYSDDVESISVDTFESQKSQRLLIRTEALPENQRKLAMGETRQYSYRRGVKNPLFSYLNEKQRKAILNGCEMREPKVLIEDNNSKTKKKKQSKASSVSDCNKKCIPTSFELGKIVLIIINILKFERYNFSISVIIYSNFISISSSTLISTLN